jgi:hypothetical protein
MNKKKPGVTLEMLELSCAIIRKKDIECGL